MMTIKNYIKKLIGQGKSDIGVDCALSELKNLDEQTKNSLILAKARFSDLVDKLNNRTINNEDFEVNKSQINSSILFILDNLDKEYNTVEVTSEIYCPPPSFVHRLCKISLCFKGVASILMHNTWRRAV